MKSININEPIKVKLTPLGAEIYYHRYDAVINDVPNAAKKYFAPRLPKTDIMGFTEFQLWEFMNIYGEYFSMGRMDKIIDPLNLYIEDKHVKDVKEDN